MNLPVERRDHPLAPLTTMQVGGPAARFFVAESDAHVGEIAQDFRDTPLRVLGGGSNLVVSDEGVSGPVMVMNSRGIFERDLGETVLVTASAGEVWHDFVTRTVDAGLAGLECLGGIPGKVGATPIQNVGAYGQEVAETISSVDTLDTQTGERVRFSGADCGFSYRHSRFKDAEGRYIVLSVTYSLKKNGLPSLRYSELSKALEVQKEQPSLHQVYETVVALRRSKSMVLDPCDENRRSCGSFFVNAQVTKEAVEHIKHVEGAPPPQFPAKGGMIKIPSAWLIERAGLSKGFRRGPVGLSTKHTLSLVAHEGATARDVVHFAEHVRAVVEDKYGVRLIPEPQFWGFSVLKDGLPQL